MLKKTTRMKKLFLIISILFFNLNSFSQVGKTQVTFNNGNIMYVDTVIISNDDAYVKVDQISFVLDKSVIYQINNVSLNKETDTVQCYRIK